eukprot:jgi/Galph1/115/GphlegSOOS_G4785.1
MSFGGNFGKPLFGSQSTGSGVPFGNTTSGFGGPSPFGGPQSAPAFGSNPTGLGNTTPFGASAPVAANTQPGFGISQQGVTASPIAQTPFNQGQPAFGNTGIGLNSGNNFFSGNPSSFFGSSSSFGSSPASFQSQTPFTGSSFNIAPFGSGPAPTASFGTPAFGASATQSAPTFGSSTFGFGSKNIQTGPFSSNSAFSGSFSPTGAGGFGLGSPGQTSQSNTIKGTGNPKFQPVQEHDAGGISVRYMSITRMPEYQDKSFEELRFEDYLLGRKDSSAVSSVQPQIGAFGQSSFGSGFGTRPATSFSSPQNTSTPAFGVSSSNSIFGGNTTFGGSLTSGPSNGIGSGSFGAPSGFGSSPSFFTGPPAATASNQSSSAFQMGSPFGSVGSSAGLFGSSSQKPTVGFGAPSASQQPPAFGSTPTPGFGNVGSSGFGNAFGSGSSTSQLSLNLGSFGSSFGTNRFGVSGASTVPSLGTANSSPFSSGFSFGADSSKSTSSLFPSTFGSTPQVATTPSLFGSTPAPASGNSLFGTQPLGGSSGNIFSTMGQNATTSGLLAPNFGGGSFTGIQNSSSSLFGTTAPSVSFSTPSQPNTGFNLTGATGLGSQNSNVFGGYPTQQYQQYSNVANVSSPYGRSPIIEAAALSVSKSSQQNGSLKSLSSSAKRGFAMGSFSSRPPTRSVARIRTRSMRSPSLHSPFLEDRHSSSLFSPEHFSLVETRNRATSSSMALSPTPKSDIKRLVITQNHDFPESRESGFMMNGMETYNTPVEKKLPFKASVSSSSDRRVEFERQIVKANGDKMDQRSMDKRQVAKPTPVRAPGQEFYEENLSPDSSAARETTSEFKNDAAPILTKESYYTVPSLDSLRKMSNEELSHVSDFRVGRTGVGEIQWIGKTDVRYLNLDRIINIENRAVLVYPDEGEKPADGVELNKPARVYLHKVWKTDKNTGLPLKDTEAVMKFTKRLKTHCEKQGLVFLGYDATQGTWSFEVPHFSRYGLPDSDDESFDDDFNDEVSRNGVLFATKKEKDSGIQEKDNIIPVDDDSYTEYPAFDSIHIKEETGAESEDVYMERSLQTSPKGLTERVSTFNTAKKTLTSRKIQKTPRPKYFSYVVGLNPEQKFFPSPDEGKQQPNKLETPKKKRSIATSLRSRPDEKPDGKVDIVDRFAESDIVKEEFPKDSVSPLKYLPIERNIEKFEPVAISESLCYGKEMMKKDMMAFSCRSFRASIGPGFQVAMPFLNFMDSKSHYTYPLLIFASAPCWDKSFILKTLQIHHSSWKASMDETEMVTNSSHRFSNRPSFRQPFLHLLVITNTLEHLITEASFSEHHHFELVLRLVKHLFVQDSNDFQRDPELDSEELELRRKVSYWLRHHACTWSQEERNSRNKSFLEAFYLLTRGEILQAIESCSQANNLRLACMVARCMQLQDDDFRSSCKRLHNFYCGQIPRDLDRIYSLLSGDVLHAMDGLSLSWYRAFALYFWYGLGAHTEGMDFLRNSLISYFSDWTTASGCSPPVPPHVVVNYPRKMHFGVAKQLTSDRLIYDACYVLFCIFANLYPDQIQLAHLSTPLAYGVDYDPLDAHKPWLVCEVLSSIPNGVSCLNSHVFTSFSLQLEMMELYSWAFYILWSSDLLEKNVLYLKDVFIRLFPLILAEEVDGINGNVSSLIFLRDELGVPKRWFEEAAAVYARYQFNALDEAMHLSQFSESSDISDVLSLVFAVNRTQEIVLKEICPIIFITQSSLTKNSDKLIKLKGILTLLSEIESRNPGIIENWDSGCGFLQYFLYLSSRQEVLIEDMLSVFIRLESFSSFVTTKLQGKKEHGEMFVSYVLSWVFRQSWTILWKLQDISQCQDLLEHLNNIVSISIVPWSCRQFFLHFLGTCRLRGLRFALTSSTRLHSSWFDQWFPPELNSWKMNKRNSCAWMDWCSVYIICFQLLYAFLNKKLNITMTVSQSEKDLVNEFRSLRLQSESLNTPSTFVQYSKAKRRLLELEQKIENIQILRREESKRWRLWCNRIGWFYRITLLTFPFLFGGRWNWNISVVCFWISPLHRVIGKPSGTYCTVPGWIWTIVCEKTVFMFSSVFLDRLLLPKEKTS